MFTDDEINEKNLIYCLNDINYGRQFAIDYFDNQHLDKDNSILLGMLPYLLMIYFSSNDFIKNHSIAIGTEYEVISKSFNDLELNDNRSVSLKLYGEKPSSFEKNSKHLEKLDKESIKYSIYLCNTHIVSNTHLQLFKQIDYFNLKCDIKSFFCKLFSKFFILNKCPQKFLCKLNHFNFDIDINSQILNLNKMKKCNINSVIALIDILSTLNFYNEYIKYNQIDDIMNFKIKYQVLANSIFSIKNIKDNIYIQPDYSLFSDLEKEKINEFDKKYINNAIVKITRHGNYIDKETPINILKKYSKTTNVFIKKIETKMNVNFSDLYGELDIAIEQLISIIENHIKVNDNSIYIV